MYLGTMSETDMLNPVHTLIASKISQLKAEGRDLPMAEISRRLGRNPTYLQQFIRRGTPKELDEQDRFRLAQMLDVNPEELRGPGKKRRAKLSDQFQQSHPAIKPVARSPQSSIMPAPRIDVADPPGPQKPTNLEVPVYQTWQAGGRMVIARRSFTHFSSPPSLGLSDRAYCVQVPDDSMSPEHKRGSMAIIDPGLEVQPDMTCIFREALEGGEILIRQVKAINRDDYVVQSYDSKNREHLPKARFPYVHQTIGNIFRPF